MLKERRIIMVLRSSSWEAQSAKLFFWRNHLAQEREAQVRARSKMEFRSSSEQVLPERGLVPAPGDRPLTAVPGTGLSQSSGTILMLELWHRIYMDPPRGSCVVAPVGSCLGRGTGPALLRLKLNRPNRGTERDRYASPARE